MAGQSNSLLLQTSGRARKVLSVGAEGTDQRLPGERVQDCQRDKAPRISSMAGKSDAGVFSGPFPQDCCAARA